MLIRAVEDADARGHDDLDGLAKDIADRLALDIYDVEIVEVDCSPFHHEAHVTVRIRCPQVEPDV